MTWSVKISFMLNAPPHLPLFPNFVCEARVSNAIFQANI
jgi:hypothetical protein